MEGFDREWISRRGVNGAGSMKQILPNTKILNQANWFLEEKKIIYELFEPGLDGGEHGCGARPYKPGA